MKKSLILALLVVLIGIPYVYAGDGATINNDFQCWIPDALTGLGTDIYTDQSHAVLTPPGNVTLTCNFVVPDGYLPATTLKDEGFACNTSFGLTYDSKYVITKGGQAMLSCKIKANSN